MEAEVCKKLEECGCEYAGQLYNVSNTVISIVTGLFNTALENLFSSE